MAANPAAPAATPTKIRHSDAASLSEQYDAVRGFTEEFCEPLNTEDYVVQTVENVSPTKWHLAHTTWFFETFILKDHVSSYEPLNETYAYLFNSYYIQAGERHCRDRRGYISRPTVSEVYAYRAHVDDAMHALMSSASGKQMHELAPLIEIGLHHEQQHQELMVTDMKHVLSVNPLRPAYRDDLTRAESREAPALQWVGFDEGVYEIGFDDEDPDAGFCYDNETPRHREFLESFQLANRLVTCGEYLEFMRDGGYERPELWLSAGWAMVQEKEWTEPFYWEAHDDQYYLYTLGGLREVNPAEPVSHLSYYEAEAFARWADARLPTEAEWEIASRGVPLEGNFVDEGHFHPQPLPEDAEGAVPELGDGPLHQMFGDVWEWTRSHYSPYPGYEPLPGALGEYNGKFMCGQFVLRGGSCATSRSHIRRTYRNFFHPDEAWQFMGLRLARDAG
ncbi:hypothetical protein CRI94_06140 [Longibacter salinarum]|uniref:Ergothioneine biosynthesis protein EgtB n=1 Tax=Longibacter salinarum TaxID=1850348 RepID=A0A2A8D0V1_9BACT|nr:ergothioneine biosynthesis protein EgtB [Longibacter salinarum]PEN14599.1 hypothetical protein CRI94_06140 [Longibacter salinarum]